MDAPNEIRVGNYFIDPKRNCNCQIIGIDLENSKSIVKQIDTESLPYKLIGDNYDIGFDDLEKIPITEGWLKDFGFDQISHVSNIWAKRNSKGEVVHITFSINYQVLKIGTISYEQRKVGSIDQIQNAFSDMEWELYLGKSDKQ